MEEPTNNEAPIYTIKKVSVLSVTSEGVHSNPLGVFSAEPDKSLFLTTRNSIIATDKGLYHVEDLVLPFQNSSTFSEKCIVNIVSFRNGSSIATKGSNKVIIYTKKRNTVFRRVDALRPGDIVVHTHGLESFGSSKESFTSIMGEEFRKPNKKRAPITVPTNMTTALARLLGLMGTNDCMRAGKIEFAQEQEILDIFKKDMHDTFGNRYAVTKTPEGNIGGGSDYLKMVKNTSMEVIDFIKYISSYGMHTGKTIPKAILRADKEDLIEYIKGLTLSGIILKNGFIVCSVSDFKFVREIILVLSQFGIKATARRHGTLKTYKSINDQNQEVPAIAIIVQGIEAIKFYEQIGFIQTRKQEVAKKMIALLSSHLPEETVPNMGISSLLVEGLRTKKITLPRRLLKYFMIEKVNDPLPRSVLIELKDIGIDIPEILVNKNLTFTAVTHNELSSYKVNTYDVYSEEATFFSCNGVIMRTLDAPEAEEEK